MTEPTPSRFEPARPAIALPDPNGETVLIDSPAGEMKVQPPWWCWIIDRNPLFLLSGLSMFAGCFAISRSIHADPENPRGLLMLVGLLVVLNLYELMVIALGLVLRAALRWRDARHLLGLALLLMIDLGFVYHESATASLSAGVAIGAAATVLGLIKQSHDARLGVRLTAWAVGLVGLDLGAVFFMPVVMRWIAGDGFVSPGAMMGVFGASGLFGRTARAAGRVVAHTGHRALRPATVAAAGAMGRGVAACIVGGRARGGWALGVWHGVHGGVCFAGVARARGGDGSATRNRRRTADRVAGGARTHRGGCLGSAVGA